MSPPPPPPSRRPALRLLLGLALAPSLACAQPAGGAPGASTAPISAPASAAAHASVASAAASASGSGPTGSGPTGSGPAAEKPAARDPRIDTAFPFQYEALRLEGGGTFRLQSVEGQPLMVHFWASWCRPCLQEMPHVAALHARYADAGLRLVMVSVDESAAALRAYLQRSFVPGILLHDPSNEASLVFGVGSLPATYIYDRRGRLVLSTDRMLRPGDPAVDRALDAAVQP